MSAAPRGLPAEIFRPFADSAVAALAHTPPMTLIWFVIWFVSDRIGDHASLTADPVNAWTWTLLLAIALDLSGLQASGQARRRRGS